MLSPAITIMLIVAMMTFGSVFWIWMLIDCALNKGLRQGAKTAWMIFILFTHWVGALIYFFACRPFRNSVIEFEYSSYAQSEEPSQAYQRGYRSPKSYSAPLEEGDDVNEIPARDPRHKRRRQPHSLAQYEQPQATYQTEHQSEYL